MSHVVLSYDDGVECFITLLGLRAREEHEHKIEHELQIDEQVDPVDVPPLVIRVKGKVVRKGERYIYD